MACEQCDRLRRDLREAREERDEWKRVAEGQDEASEAVRLMAVIEMKRVLGLAPAPGWMLLALMQSRAPFVRREALMAARAAPGRTGECETTKVVDVYVTKIRNALRAAGFRPCIVNVWGQGYRLERDVADRLWAAMPELAQAAKTSRGEVQA